MASVFQTSVAQVLAQQPWYVRRKDTLTAVAGTVLQAANLLILVSGETNETFSLVLAVVIGLAQILIHAGTRGAITPSMATRLEHAGLVAHLDRPSVTAPVTTEYVGKRRAPDTTELPIYTGPTTAGE